jgi:hypothetical protein
MARNGKIARLPQNVREELNQRLADSEDGAVTLDWLNGLELVKEFLAGEFGGREINKQNLSEWRRGGFVEWELRESFCRQAPRRKRVNDLIATESKQLDPEFVDSLAAVVAGRLAELLARWDGEVTAEMERKLKWLGRFSQEVARLQRGQVDAAVKRNALARQQLEDAEAEADREDGELDDSYRQDLICRILGKPLPTQSVKAGQGDDEETEDLEEDEEEAETENEEEAGDEAPPEEADKERAGDGSELAQETVETVEANGNEERGLKPGVNEKGSFESGL